MNEGTIGGALLKGLVTPQQSPYTKELAAKAHLPSGKLSLMQCLSQALQCKRHSTFKVTLNSWHLMLQLTDAHI